MHIGRLNVLTDIKIQKRYSHAELAKMALSGGAEVIQFRHKQGAMRDKLALLEPVADVCLAKGRLLVVDDHLDLALAVGASGVHLGQDDLPVEKARDIIQRQDGATRLIGATCTTVDQAVRAQEAGASYIGFGPVYSTTSKANPAAVKGLDGLSAACEAVSIPIIAIGGIIVDRVQDVLEAGAHGVAVMSAIVAAHDVTKAATAFREEIDRVCAQLV